MIEICIINYKDKYEYNRTEYFLKNANIDCDQIIKIENISQIQSLDIDYIAFLNTYDIWARNKIIKVWNIINDATNFPDIILHSYTQHYGRKQYLVDYLCDDNCELEDQFLIQGFPGISAMVFSRTWLLKLNDIAGCDLKIGSEKFYSILEKEIIMSKPKINIIPLMLSEHWSNKTKKMYSELEGLEDICNYWSRYKDLIKERSLQKNCYLFFCSIYGNNNVKKLFQAIEMNEDEIISLMLDYQYDLKKKMQNIEDNSNRKNDFYLLMRNWVDLHLAGQKIDDILRKDEITTVGIYGAGKHGKMLCEELKDSGISVICLIDRNSEQNNILGYPILSIEDELPVMDAIIISPFREFETIKRNLMNKTNAKIISLAELVGR